MKIKVKTVWFWLILTLPMLAHAQVKDVLLFSKMELKPKHTLWDGKSTILMGFTDRLSSPVDLPNPTLIFTEGDSVALELRNFSQSAPHTIHLHGLDVDQQNDGVPHLSFEIFHMESGTYRFKAPHPGTYLYHCHVVSPLHVQAGMYGLLIVKPKGTDNLTWTGGYSFDREYAWLTSELDSTWHSFNVIHNKEADKTPLPHYDPQYFLINGKSEHQLSDTSIKIVADYREKVYLRLANIGNLGNRYIFPGQIQVETVSSDGRPLPMVDSANTLEIFPGERYGSLLSVDALLTDSILVEYVDLNTHNVINTQKVSVEFDDILAISPNKVNNIRIYPNPASNYIDIEIPNTVTENRQLTILTLNGKIISETKLLDGNVNPVRIDTGDLPNGIYLVRLSNSVRNYYSKLIIHSK